MAAFHVLGPSGFLEPHNVCIRQPDYPFCLFTCGNAWVLFLLAVTFEGVTVTRAAPPWSMPWLCLQLDRLFYLAALWDSNSGHGVSQSACAPPPGGHGTPHVDDREWGRGGRGMRSTAACTKCLILPFELAVYNKSCQIAFTCVLACIIG